MLLILSVTDSLFLATPESKRVLMHSCHMLCILCVEDLLFLAKRRRKRVVPFLPLVCIFCVVGACTQALVHHLRALCYCVGACTQPFPEGAETAPLAIAVSDNRLHQIEAFFSHLLGIHVGKFSFNFHWAGSALWVQGGHLLVV